MWSSIVSGCVLAFFAVYAVISLASVGYWAWRTCFPKPTSDIEASPDYSRSVTSSAYRVGKKQVVFHPLRGTMFWQVDDHALRKLRDVPPLREHLKQRHSPD